jgi:AraC-like DNA-binding protein
MTRSVRHTTLLPLAFGNRTKMRVEGLRAFAEMLGQSGYRMFDLGVPGGTASLAVETAFVSLPGVTLLAVSSSAHWVTTSRTGRVSLCFGFDGSGTLAAGRLSAAYHRAAGVLLPEGRAQWRIDAAASDFEASFDRHQLTTTARAMLGVDKDAPLPGWNLDDLRPVPVTAGVVEGRTTLIRLAIQGDRYRSQPRVLAASGIEDQCLRQAVFLLMPEAFQQTPGMPGKQTAIDRLCEWLRASLDSPITLTDMERFSGLAARTLQLSFLKRFELSPMAWFREQRLVAARTMLEHSHGMDATAAVELVATSCGFGSAANLRKRYRMRFGDSPADTLRMAR